MSTATLSATSFPPLVRSIVVPVGPDAAFRRFTDEMGTWWPLATHSVGRSNATGVRMEPRVGGRIIESTAGGEEVTWGTLNAYDPPRLVAFTWHPGDEPERAQDVEVRFEPAGAGTRVTLTHTGFERLGDNAQMARRGYPLGWTYVLGLYAGRRGVGMALLTGFTRVVMAVAGRIAGR